MANVNNTLHGIPKKMNRVDTDTPPVYPADLLSQWYRGRDGGVTRLTLGTELVNVLPVSGRTD